MWSLAPEIAPGDLVIVWQVGHGQHTSDTY